MGAVIVVIIVLVVALGPANSLMCKPEQDAKQAPAAEQPK